MNSYKHLMERDVVERLDASIKAREAQERLVGFQQGLRNALAAGVAKPNGDDISATLRRNAPCAPNLDPAEEAAKDLTTSKPSAFDRQVGGSHYKDYPIQTWDLVKQNKLDYWQGTIIKYLLRWPDKGGEQDLQKALHTLEAYLEVVRETGWGLKARDKC